MFYGNDVVGGGQQRSYDLSSFQSLPHVQITRWLIEHIPARSLGGRYTDHDLFLRTRRHAEHSS